MVVSQRDDLTQQLVWCDGIVRFGHRVAPRQKRFHGILDVLPHDTVDKKPVFAGEQNDITGLHLIDGSCFYGEKVSRPKSRQHAVPKRCKSQSSGSTKNLT